MLKLIRWILLWLRGGTLKLLGLTGIILLVWGTLSPVGTLVWWANEAESLAFKKNRSRDYLLSGMPVRSLNLQKLIVILFFCRE
jgi:hypothetical protein